MTTLSVKPIAAQQHSFLAAFSQDWGHESLDRLCARCQTDTRALHARHILITGATGFFGKWLVATLLQLDAEYDLKLQLSCVSRNPPGPSSQTLTWLKGDSCRFEDPRQQVTDIIHCGTSTDAQQIIANPLGAFWDGIESTRRLLQLAVEHQTERFLFTSSGAVYGRGSGATFRFNEEYDGAPQPTDTASAYHQAKRSSEFLGCLAAQNTSLCFLIARCFAFSGPLLPLDKHFAIGNFVRDAAAKKTIQITGDGRPMRSYLEAEDLCAWLLRIFAEGRSARPYNVGSSEGLSIRTLAEKIAQQAGVTVHVAAPPTPGPVPCYVPDVQRAQQELQLQAHISLEHSVERMLRWARTPAAGLR